MSSPNSLGHVSSAPGNKNKSVFFLYNSLKDNRDTFEIMMLFCFVLFGLVIVFLGEQVRKEEELSGDTGQGFG